MLSQLAEDVVNRVQRSDLGPVTTGQVAAALIHEHPQTKLVCGPFVASLLPEAVQQIQKLCVERMLAENIDGIGAIIV